MESLTELAHDLNISKPSLYQRMKKITNFKHKYTFKYKNILMIKDKGIQLISNPKHNSTSKQFHTRKGKSTSQLTKKDLIQQNKGLTSTIISQQHTIKSQQDTLSKNLTQQRKLTNKQQKHNNNAILPESFGEKVARKEIDDYKKHGPIYRLFHNIEK